MSQAATRPNTLGVRILRFVIFLITKALGVPLGELVGNRPAVFATVFGRNVKRLRQGQGWTCEVLAERAGLAPYRLYDIEIGAAEPSLANIHALAGALRVPVGALFGERRSNHLTILGHNIRRLRKAHAWTVEELAARAGLSPNWLDRIELGTAEPSLAAMSAIAKALGVSMVDLIRSRPPNRGTVLGQNIRRLREAYGWTVEELAARAGVSPNWLDGVERGAAAPSLMAASAVAKALGVPLGELFGDRPPDRDPPSPGAPACRAPAQFAVPFRPLDRGLESASWHQAKRSRERKPAAMRGGN